MLLKLPKSESSGMGQSLTDAAAAASVAPDRAVSGTRPEQPVPNSERLAAAACVARLERDAARGASVSARGSSVSASEPSHRLV